MPQSLFFIRRKCAWRVSASFYVKKIIKPTKMLIGIYYFHTFIAEINIE